ncbi:MAG TPA: oxalate/formate MFS antiporter [Candidatus Cybelea sp.]|nr:oxalate/formate MFS antiporter [Candidatus Cybelea sp.]
MSGAEASVSAPASGRVGQLVAGVVVMMAISSPQYVWTLFAGPLRGVTGVGPAEIQTTFSILIVLQTFFSPFQASLVDRFGPRRLIAVGAVLSGASWVLSAYVQNIWVLYATYGLLGGFGTGIVYVGVIGLMVRWFPDRRGFATGMAAAGYGAGAILTSFPIADMIQSSGYARTLVVFGCLQGLIGVAAAQFLRQPPAGWRPSIVDTPSATATRTRRSYRPSEMLRHPAFWLLFAMMTMMSTGGLMVTSQVATFAKEFGVAGAVVLGFAAVPFSLTLSRVTNGLTRPFFGWVSDRIGRELTMFIAFSLEAAAIAVLLAFAGNPALFVVLTGLVFFGWGEIFSLFPSTLTDLFGPDHAMRNYGFLYIAQGVGSILGAPVSAYLREQSGSWTLVFAIVVALDLLTAILAVTALRRLRAAHLRPA